MEKFFFAGWDGLIRVILVGSCAYVSLVLLLRISGNRTLSKMNAFDFVVTVALGSTLASLLLSKDVPLADGVAALALLIGLQFVVTWSGVRLPWVRNFVTGEPHLLFYRGSFIDSSMKKRRVNEQDVLAAIREEGLVRMEDVDAVVLETDGSFSVIIREDETRIEKSSLSTVNGIEESRSA
ncbi:MAG: DUF421 domain-containing protein [Thermoanaerobaculia bacterium]|nr:DUF421 domain-containing protein [Thermoanaerobaculia bacterium]